MIKRMVIMLVLVGVVLGGVFGFKNFVNGKIKEFMTGPTGPGSAPQTVSTAKAAVADWQQQLVAVGSLRAVKGSDLSIELAGVVDEINFESGQDVEAGKVLLKLRSEDDVAKLKSLEAQADLSEVTYDRDLKQLKAQAISQAVVDKDAADLKNNRAQVEQQRAILEKKTLKAPFAGHLGLRQVDLGQYLAPGNVVVTLQALTPIFADFLLPQQALDKIKVGQAVTAKVDTYPGKTFPGKIMAIVADLESRYDKLKVYVIGTSRSTESTMALTKPLDGQVAGFVHTSSVNAIASLDPRGLKSRHLIVAHDRDGCRVTRPANAQASHKSYGTDLIMMDGGKSVDDDCEAWAYHGYNGIEKETVDKIKAWILAGP